MKIKVILPERELLFLYLDLYSMSPDTVDWSEQYFKDNPPRLIRYQNFCALAGALQLPYQNISQFEWGDFVQESHLQVWDEIMALASERFQVNPGLYGEDYTIHAGILSDMFFVLLNAAKNVYKVVTSGGGIIEPTGYHHCYVHILHHIAHSVMPIQENIHEILYLILNPQKIMYPLEVLVKEFGYQEVDLNEIDGRWI